VLTKRDITTRVIESMDVPGTVSGTMTPIAVAVRETFGQQLP